MIERLERSAPVQRCVRAVQDAGNRPDKHRLPAVQPIKEKMVPKAAGRGPLPQDLDKLLSRAAGHPMEPQALGHVHTRGTRQREDKGVLQEEEGVELLVRDLVEALGGDPLNDQPVVRGLGAHHGLAEAVALRPEEHAQRAEQLGVMGAVDGRPHLGIVGQGQGSGVLGGGIGAELIEVGHGGTRGGAEGMGGEGGRAGFT